TSQGDPWTIKPWRQEFSAGKPSPAEYHAADVEGLHCGSPPWVIRVLFHPVTIPSQPTDLRHPMKLCLFGAAPGTGNKGVSALWRSAAAAIARIDPKTSLNIFDYGKGRRQDSL